MKPVFYDTCSHFIVCKTCGFQTKSTVDMVEHLLQIQKYKEENCTEKLLELVLNEKGK